MRLATLVFALALAGCAGLKEPPRPTYTTPAAVKAGTTKQFDSYSKMMVYRGPDASPVSWIKMELQAVKPATGQPVYQLFTNHIHSGAWIFYQGAIDSDGNRLVHEASDRDVNCARSGCTYSESSRVVLSRSYLEQKAQTGIDLRIGGRTESMIVKLSPAYVQGFLLATN